MEQRSLQGFSSTFVGRRLGGMHAWVSRHIGERPATAAGIFVAISAVVFVIGFAAVTTIQPKYTALAIIAPQASVEEDAALGTTVQGFNGLGSLLGGTGISANMQAFQVLSGTAEFADYAMNHDHLDRILFPEGVHHGVISTTLHAMFGQPVSNQVTVGDVQKALQTGILVEQRTLTPYLEVYYTNKNRDQAIRVLNTVLFSADRILRAREAGALDSQINYLTSALANTADVDRLDSFRKLLNRKLTSKVLIETQVTYSFKIFDAPFAPTVPNSPNIAILLVVVALGAVVAGAIGGIGWLWWSGRP